MLNTPHIKSNKTETEIFIEFSSITIMHIATAERVKPFN